MIELLRSRRSIRKFKATPLSKEAIDTLKEAVLRSPSSRGKNPWEFVFVQDRATLEALSHAKDHGGEFLKNAALGIVVAGNETVSDVWIEDCSIAAILVQLTAHSLGLGSCWVQIRNRNHADGSTAENVVRKIVSLPSHLRVLAIVGIGVPGESLPGVPAGKLQYDKIHLEKIG